MRKILNIDGMTCGHCQMHVANALKELDGVDSVDVNLEEKRAVIDFGGEVSDSELEKAVTEAGYSVTKVSEG